MKVNVAAAIIEKNRKILIAQRLGTCKREPNKWEFPGGKIENETPEECLVREIREELGVVIEVKEHFATSSTVYPDEVEIILSTYFARMKSGKLKKLEVQDFKWVGLEELEKIEFAKPDVPIVEFLLLRNIKNHFKSL